jgi:hypothetical protein
VKLTKHITIEIGKKQTAYAIGVAALTVAAVAIAIINPRKRYDL